MSLISQETLYTDLDPVGPLPGRVLLEGDTDARFVLCAANTPIPTELAQRFGLDDHKSVIPFDWDEARATLAAQNRQTYADNARILGGPAFKGLVENTSIVSPSEK
ncbi:hypothetical protein IAD21_00685 [Abditibacteriota bacterium]|nr:hypothetical protein IAD21_00685 [Abditibacteriota bacterium]